ncbi:MAG: Sel1 repeat [Pseudomonadota bacterium]
MSVPLPDPLRMASLQLSAAHGEPEAQYELALLFLRGQGVAHDPVQARHWLRLAAQQGHAPAVSLMTGIPQGHVVNGP